MMELLDYFAEAISNHKRGDIGAAYENYAKAFACASHINDDEVRCMVAVCRQFLYHHYNGTRAGNTMDKNGEIRVLSELGRRGARVIFDVGANIGYWALRAAETNPAAVVHSFEIFDDTFAQFKANTAAQPRIVANGFGLSAYDGVAEVHYAEGVDSAHFTTVFSFDNGEKRACPVVRGDRYMAEKGVERIDFLKIDVEGGEFDVLTGFESALSRRAIPVIQFEYGPASLDSHNILKDYYKLLTGYGYVIGRLHGGGVNFRSFTIEEENFINANFIACLETEKALVEALSFR